jgi:hypothetical protein
MDEHRKLLLSATTDIVCAQLSKAGCDSTKIPGFITDVYSTLAGLHGAGAVAAAAPAEPVSRPMRIARNGASIRTIRWWRPPTPRRGLPWRRPPGSVASRPAPQSSRN